MRTAGAYIVGVWLVLQITSVVFPQLGLPTSAQTLVLFLSIAGLPAVMLAAWHFDISLSGIVPEAQLEGHRTHTSIGRLVDVGVILALLAIIAYLVWDRAQLTSRASLPVKGASIAVLAFADFSGGKQSYLGDGISEEIINVLAQSDDLRVTARTSSFAFKGENRDIREIAEALSVSYVLEGSVRSSKDRVRVTAQLIDAESGFHLWSDTFDRSDAEIFELEDEIAGAVLLATNSSVLSDSKSSAQTRNLDALAAYEQGRQNLEERTEDSIYRATHFFRTAIALDENYALAHAALAESLFASSELFFGIGMREWAGLRKEIDDALEKAIELAPDEPSVIAVSGLKPLFEDRPVLALERFDEALERSPNHALAHYWRSLALEHAGQHAAGRKAMETAYELNPLARDIAERHVSNLILQSRFVEAEGVAEKLKRHHPNAGTGYRASFMNLMAQNDVAAAHAVLLEGLDATGREVRLLEDLAEIYVLLGMEKALQSVNGPEYLQIDLRMNEGECEEAVALAIKERSFEPDNLDGILFVGAAMACAGNVDEARTIYEDVLTRIRERELSPFQFDFLVSDLALMRKQAGDEAAAQSLLSELKAYHAENILTWGPNYRHLPTDAARIAILEGRTDAAIESLRRGLKKGLDAPTLRMEFVFLSLAGEPDYKLFMREYGAHLQKHRAAIEDQLEALP